jgi:hypothetical protein
MTKDFKNCQAWRMLFLMTDFATGLREISFPTKIKEGGWLKDRLKWVMENLRNGGRGYEI